MGRGDFETAWRVSDRVLAGRERVRRDDPAQPYHLRWVWDGRPFEQRRVLVRCYHGLGDTLQFCRFLAPLRRRSSHLALETQHDLLDVLADLEGPDELLAFDPARPRPPSECDIEIMELSHALRLAPTSEPYLRLKTQPARSAVRIGVCWQSSLTWLPERSVPPHLFAPLLANRDVEFVSLQRGGPVVAGLADDCPASVAGTAERIAGLDLVISVDTMVAHLTGALGVPLWLLLKAEPDWRWRAGGAGSVWYGRIRKFQQPCPGDWEPPMRAVAADLEAMLRAGTLLARRSCQRA